MDKDRIEEIKAICERAKQERWHIKKNGSTFSFQAINQIIPELITALETEMFLKEEWRGDYKHMLAERDRLLANLDKPTPK